MKRALKLARRGEGRVSPNPMVGAVIVKDGRIIGEGYHERYGEDHAEVNAIRKAVGTIEGATFYITLEPCCHFGKTPPCVESLIACRPARVVIGTTDPNPLVAGRGIEALHREGIATVVGILERDCRELNEVFFKFIQTGMPFVTLKFAQTLDGRIATATGHSQWISGLSARRYAHRLRACHDAVLVGVGTVSADDPELTVRHVKGRNPLPIVLDSKLSISLSAKVLRKRNGRHPLLVTTERADPEKRTLLAKAGIEALVVAGDSRARVDLKAALAELGKRNLSSILIEGGATVATSVLQSGLADRLIVIIAPKIVGRGIESVGDLGIRRMDHALAVSWRKITRRGGDLILDGRITPEDKE
ncbi:MAG: bifunctional diaminohydroxyphosphoribosylaminopyrimidine deaminase/5-amino-6-(5-phosphoribosylamino)uracil reductase RibD [Deltaproteobacteria bacterium]|nr:bifunctional diaminohydroxyphosphoribosylaminopyrimidine deaminase/5-amino-6-(5-phosphoribosylamino)uracil reductase RibD [Deltaproteobacteria bacterium]